MKNNIQDLLERIEKNTLLAAKKVLTFNDVVLMTGLSRSHLYKLTADKEIPHYKPTGKVMFFDRAEVEAWLKQNRVASEVEIEERAARHIINADIKKGGKK